MTLLPHNRGCVWLSARPSGVLMLHAGPCVTCHHRSQNEQNHACGIHSSQLVACNNAPGRQAIRTTAGSPVHLLQAVELAALSLAAAYQAHVIVTAASQHVREIQRVRRESLLPTQETSHSAEAPLRFHQQQQHLHQQACPLSLQQAASTAWQPLAAPHSGTQLQNLALLLALMCGVALRHLQRPRLPTCVPSVDAAARLVGLELLCQQQAGQVTSMAKQLDKLQARVRLSTSDLKVPLRQAQGSTAQAAAAISQLAAQQQQLQQQLNGSQELIAALQGLAAKQFKVSTEALQQLKASQSHLSSTTATALQELKQQQRALQQQLEQQRRLADAEVRSWHQQQQSNTRGLATQAGVFGDHSGDDTCSGGSGWSDSSCTPDPWAQSSPAQMNGSSNGVINS